MSLVPVTASTSSSSTTTIPSLSTTSYINNIKVLPIKSNLIIKAYINSTYYNI